ncbi:MAG TPA: F0F1 ATP synthase subunit delta [Candidatus Saccharimonadales bacterium]|nr:F0F1 ATP synthase subunit delta [Candidatus Saccharimonadales bacterium]
MADAQKRQFVLPASLAEPADIARAAREIDEVDDVLRESEIRNNVQATTLPRMSKGLLEMAEQNGLNLLQKQDREISKRLLDALVKTAPVLHISFAAEPSPPFVFTIINELRKRIHPLVLVQIGLQPSLAGGCMVRTESMMFDFSLRQHMEKNKHKLAEIFASMPNNVPNTEEQTPAKPADLSSDAEAAEITQIAQPQAAPATPAPEAAA